MSSRQRFVKTRVRVYTAVMVAGNPTAELFEVLEREQIAHLIVAYYEPKRGLL